MKCIYTGDELDSSTQQEHILQNFLGATWKSANVSCNAVQNQFGQGCDAALEKAFRFMRNMIGARGQRSSSMQGVWMQSDDGHKYLLKNGEYQLVDPVIGSFEDLDDHTKRITAFVGTKDKVGWAKALVQKNLPPGYSRVQEMESVCVRQDMSEVGKLSCSVCFPDAAAHKGILKSCFNLLGATDHDIAMQRCFDPLRKCLVGEKSVDDSSIADFCRFVSDGKHADLPKRGSFDHVLCVYSEGCGVYGFARFYGQFDFAMRISEGYRGGTFQHGYCVDPFGEHGGFERRYDYKIDVLPKFESQDANITKETANAFGQCLERFLDSAMIHDIVNEVMRRLQVRQKENPLVMLDEIMAGVYEECKNVLEKH